MTTLRKEETSLGGEEASLGGGEASLGGGEATPALVCTCPTLSWCVPALPCPVHTPEYTTPGTPVCAARWCVQQVYTGQGVSGPVLARYPPESLVFLAG